MRVAKERLSTVWNVTVGNGSILKPVDLLGLIDLNEIRAQRLQRDRELAVKRVIDEWICFGQVETSAELANEIVDALLEKRLIR